MENTINIGKIILPNLTQAGRWVTEHELFISQVYIGTNHSGSNFDRLAFKQMLRNINIESSAVSEGQKVEVKWLEMF